MCLAGAACRDGGRPNGRGRRQLRSFNLPGRCARHRLVLAILIADQTFVETLGIGGASGDDACQSRQNGRPPKRTDHHNDTHHPHPYAPTQS